MSRLVARMSGRQGLSSSDERGSTIHRTCQKPRLCRGFSFLVPGNLKLRVVAPGFAAGAMKKQVQAVPFPWLLRRPKLIEPEP